MVGEGSPIVTAEICVVAVVQVQCLTWEFPYAWAWPKIFLFFKKRCQREAKRRDGIEGLEAGRAECVWVSHAAVWVQMRLETTCIYTA